jgi:16S rRNA (guanine966-N2)-methyltransferase
VRVVAGVARGRVLRAPLGRATRPTGDRVRESIFSILTNMGGFEGATVLDLFAGSGALGIEALSRGAEYVIFVDDDAAALRTVKANLKVVGELAGRASVVQADALRYAEQSQFADLVLADPPYAFDRWSELLDRIGSKTGILVAETGRPLNVGRAWETMKVKRYGGTVVTVARPANGLEVVVREGED